MSDATDAPALLSHPGVVRVSEALVRGGSGDRVTVLDESARTAEDAARALGVEVGQIVKSLVFVTHDSIDAPADSQPKPLLVLTSGIHQVDVHKVADLLGTARIDRADADFVRQQTGFAIGGVAPIGTARPIPTLVDVELSRWDVVWAAGGHPHVVFPTTYEELLRLTAGQPAEVV